MSTGVRGTPHKRKRRTRAEIAALDEALWHIAGEHAPCTVRQVYYRAVVAELCDKTSAGYNLVQRRLLAMRRDGRVPYSHIQDNARTYYGRTRYRDLLEFGLSASRHLYALDYWRDSDVAVELWVESDSIAGTLIDTVVHEWGLRLHVARGFSSETFLYNAAAEIRDDGRPTHVYTLSDFDPSGVNLADDIAAKLTRFARPVPVLVERIALSGAQVDAWGLPTRPLKRSDRRAPGFEREHGSRSCELEAVPPNTLRELVSAAIAAHVSPGAIEAAKQDERLQREALLALPDFMRDLRGGA